MQYVLVIYQGTTPVPTDKEAWATLSHEEQSAIYRDYGQLNKTPGLTGGPPLGLPADAPTVKVADGEVTTTDGPWLGVTQAVGGFAVLEAEDLKAAIDVASRIPAARYGGAIEIRPAATYW